MPYPILVWTALGVIGGFLLVDESKLRPRQKWGIGLIFVGFIFQVYWEITHPWSESTISSLIFVTGYLAIAFCFLVWPGWLRKARSRKENDSGKAK